MFDPRTTNILLRQADRSQVRSSEAKQEKERQEHNRIIMALATGTPVKIFFPTQLGIGGVTVEGLMVQPGPSTSIVSAIVPGKRRRGKYIASNQHLWPR